MVPWPQGMVSQEAVSSADKYVRINEGQRAKRTFFFAELAV